MKVGRLDYNSEGLLLLTNDGALARHLEHPSSHIERTYLVRIHGNVTQAHLNKIQGGANIQGVHYGKIDAAIMPNSTTSATWIKVKLWEGKNREIRTVFQHMGMHVARLIRIQYGPYKLVSNMQRNSVTKVNIAKHLLQNLSDEFWEKPSAKE